MPLPKISSSSIQLTQYADYLAQLQSSSFSGDIEDSYTSRLAVATDNSIYQKLPQAVIFPRSIDDLMCIGRLAKSFPEVAFSGRGGGTGTNGQSLTDGIVVDMSRHMNTILEFNQEESWVKVQSGVVKDQLNDFLRPFGFFFAPDLSTSNRATIGGMISTDASGQGSLVYGKTSDHVLGLTSVLVDGTYLTTSPQAKESAENLANGDTAVARVYRQVLSSCESKRQEILAKFPRLNRFLTGYDLENVFDPSLTQFDLGRVITGAEGTLAFVAEAKLNVTPIAHHKTLINIKYDSFESALRHAPAMIEANATSVETVDSKVLNLAREDIIWHSVSDLITDVPNQDMQGLNMVEYNSNDSAEISQRIAELESRLQQEIDDPSSGVIGYQLTSDKSDIGKIYAMRKKAVGLLGKTDNSQKPIAFAEDTAVPPENLADFIMEFRALLDAKGLQYGMFGHVDAGVLHVRPALDMLSPEQERLMREISDEVVALVAKYGGLMWGEHGKGYRSEYGPAFFGDELFQELRKIKAAFDPHNQMNPGKICTPADSSATLVSVDDTKRGSYDRQIPVDVRDAFVPAMSCNGNGLCFNYDATSPMCPSSKVTRDRRHSPKGRAGMMREWLRLSASQGVDVVNLENEAKTTSWFSRLVNSVAPSNKNDFSHEVKEVMDGCLACKACANQCPINVDVPSFKSRFLSIYHSRYLRPWKDHLVSNIEKMAPVLAKAPRLVNALQGMKISRVMINKLIGYVDSPELSYPTLEQRLKIAKVPVFDLPQFKRLAPTDQERVVVIVQDPFTSFYEASVVESLAELINKLGYKANVLPFRPNGKPQHVKGFLPQFTQTAESNAQLFNELHQLSVPMVGVDPSLVLCYRDEYNQVLGEERGDFLIQLVHEWLQTIELPDLATENKTQSYVFLGHCSEKTALPKSENQWQAIFEAFGLNLKPVAVGCCGMAGTYGHETVNLENSKALYDMSWAEPIANTSHEVVATGYSCRSQIKRFGGVSPRHPLQVLCEQLP